MTTRETPKYWFWSHDIEQSNIGSLISPGTRLVRLSEYHIAGRQRYAAILYSETGPVTRYRFDLPVKDVLALSQDNTQHPVSITVDNRNDVPKFSLVTEENVKSASAVKLDIDETELKALVNAQQGITDFTTYTSNGKRLFGAIVEPRTTSSWLLVGVTASELDQQLRQLKASLVRVRSYKNTDGKRVYAAIAEPIEGKRKIWWYTDLTADEVAKKLEDHHAYPVDLDAMDYTDQLRFTVVMRAEK